MSDSRPPLSGNPQLDHLAVARARELQQSLLNSFSSDELEDLTRAIITGITRRVAHRTARPETPDDSALETLVDALIGPSEAEATQMVLEALDGGIPIDSIYLDYLGRAAVLLGDRWNDDRATLFDVTLGTGRIYTILRGLQPLSLAPWEVGAKHALFVALEKDDHTIGVNVAASYFRQHGWHIDVVDHQSDTNLVHAMENLQHQIVGISLSQPEHLRAVIKLVVALRLAQPNVFVVLSGPAVTGFPDLKLKTDVDAIAEDAPKALDKLEQLITPMETPGNA
ncbi:MAG: cobalamin-dependent protein [Pseudomonadota bacterium]